MGHAISALIVRGELDTEQMFNLGLDSLDLPFDLKMIPLSDESVDELAERLEVFGEAAPIPVLNMKVVHRVVDLVSPGGRYAIIETDYWGGSGNQAAAVYQAGETLLAPRREERGVINAALRLLGVKKSFRKDEFDSVGLGEWRSFDL